MNTSMEFILGFIAVAQFIGGLLVWYVSTQIKLSKRDALSREEFERDKEEILYSLREVTDCRMEIHELLTALKALKEAVNAKR